MKVSLKWTWSAAGLLALLIMTVPLPASLNLPRWIRGFPEALGAANAATSGAAPGEHTIHIQASRFQYAPGVLRVNPGDRVTLELESTDVVHGLSIDGYGLEMTADPGQTARMTFIADQPGAFRFRCTATCGNLHPFMIGKLSVGPNLLLLRGSLLSVLAVLLGIGTVRRG